MEKHVTPKHVPLTIQNIKVGAEVTLIDTVTYASKVFSTQDLVLKDTPIAKKPRSKLVPLAEPVDTIGEQHVDDLVVGVEQVV